jgi:hypothetical protein
MKKLLTMAMLFLVANAYSENSITAGNDFSTILPDNWQEIPSEVLSEYSSKIKEISGVEQKYDYGYQSNESSNWLQPPYILVKIKRTGRVPEGELKNIAKINEDFKEGVRKAEDSMSGFVSSISSGATTYDSTNKILWATIAFENETYGRMKALTGVKLTEYGQIELFGYSLEKDFEHQAKTYKSIYENLKTNPKDEYKPRITDDSPVFFGINVYQSLVAGFFGGLGGIIIWLFKKAAMRKKMEENA